MRKTVLVCDDEPYILESVGYVVREEGYGVLMADNGEDALRLARTETPDMMILDISMPKKDGNLVCKEGLLRMIQFRPRVVPTRNCLWKTARSPVLCPCDWALRARANSL